MDTPIATTTTTIDDSVIIKSDPIFSYKDHPGIPALLLFININTCNLHCYKCHNRKSIKNKDTFETYNINELNSIISKHVLFGIELIIISGGEPTLVATELIPIIEYIRNTFPDLKIRIDTNGQLPNNIQLLKPYVDGFALDLKIPIKSEYSDDEQKRYSKIIGKNNIITYKNNILESINIIRDMPYTIFRTVKYPILTDTELLYNESNLNLKIQYLDFYYF